MLIQKNIFDQLLNLPSALPEMGGILGLHHDVIDSIMFDCGKPQGNCGTYVPDTATINQQIKLWNISGIQFGGIFHTHLPRWNRLSGEDIKYISRIMSVMPPDIPCLYFPLVFPGESVLSFAVHKTGNEIVIKLDDIKIT